jgi:hypothetical protein
VSKNGNQEIEKPTNQTNRKSGSGTADKDSSNRRCSIFHHPCPLDDSFFGKQVALPKAQDAIGANLFIAS